jgi:hypothetical protein
MMTPSKSVSGVVAENLGKTGKSIKAPAAIPLHFKKFLREELCDEFILPPHP